MFLYKYSEIIKKQKTMNGQNKIKNQKQARFKEGSTFDNNFEWSPATRRTLGITAFVLKNRKTSKNR